MNLHQLNEEARAGRLTHALSVLTVLLRQVRGPRTDEDLQRFDAAIVANWPGPVVRLGPLSIGVQAGPDDDAALEQLARAISIALVGGDMPGLVNVLRMPSISGPQAAEPAPPLSAEDSPAGEGEVQAEAIEPPPPPQRPAPPPSVLFATERAAIQQILSNLQTALASLREQRETVEPTKETLARLEARIEAIGREARAPVLLQGEVRQEFESLVSRHRAVLRDLAQSAEGAKTAAQRMAEAALDAPRPLANEELAHRIETALARLERLAEAVEEAQSERAETMRLAAALEGAAQRIEAAVRALERAASPAPTFTATPPVETLAGLARRAERTSAAFDATLRAPGDGEKGAVSERLALAVEDARALFEEFLATADIQKRAWDDAEPAQTRRR